MELKAEIQNGYILLSRLLLDSQLWMLGPDAIRLATYLLLNARHKHEAKKFPGFEIGRGELVTSLSDISKGCQWYENRKVREWSRQKVSRLLERLVEIDFCEHISDTFGTHLIICNYDYYQDPDNYKSDNCGTTVEQQRDNSVHIQEGKEGKENTKRRVFQKPTLEEVQAYCKERNNNVDAKAWYDHYTSNGWKVGKNAMKDWKAAVRTWERNRIDNLNSDRRGLAPGQIHQQKDYDHDNLF